ncbi:hypothetical protein NN561_008081 [Cricetulus griseus]
MDGLAQGVPPDPLNTACSGRRAPKLTSCMASPSDYECSRQSFTSDFSSKSSSPASTSPPRDVMFDVMAAAKNLSDMTLAHEIAVNENFQLKQTALPENSLAGQVKRVVHQAFWDVLEADLSAEPPQYEYAFRLFEEIREILLSFLTGGNRLHNQICEVLDIDLIRQQAEHSAVDIQGLANYVINIMGKMCAPVRDEDIRELKATTNIVEMLRTFNLKEALNSIGVQTCAEVNKALKERGSPTLNAEAQANLIGQFSSLGEKDNPVCTLMDKRIRLYMKSLLCLPSTQKSMPPMPGGLGVIHQELEVLGCQYANIVNLNKQVYGPFYANIFRKLLFQDEAVGKTDASLPTN